MKKGESFLNLELHKYMQSVLNFFKNENPCTGMGFLFWRTVIPLSYWKAVYNPLWGYMSFALIYKKCTINCNILV